MNKEQQIDEMLLAVKQAIRDNAAIDLGEDCITLDGNEFDHIAEQTAEALYNAGYRKTFTSDLASDTQKAFKEGYEKGYSDGFDDGREQAYKDCYDKTRKETAKEILEMLREEGTFTYDYPEEPHSPMITNSEYILEEIEEKYGVEVEE